MAKRKIAVSIDGRVLDRLDDLVRGGNLESRSQGVERAVEEMLERIHTDLLERECAKLDPGYEKRMAEEGLSLDAEEWPEY
jgi:metal-responsive CopG/Arc/MetJ family transcriptional regulator